MQKLLQNPTRLVPLAFACVIRIGTAARMLPSARAGEGSAPFLTALFVATSATAVTGLSTVDIATYWSGFGQAVVYVLVHIGGFGIMAAATLIGMLVSRRMRLSSQLLAQADARGVALGDLRAVLLIVLSLAVVVEAIAAGVFTSRALARGEAFGEALWHGVFHAGTAFTNAGFSNYTEGLTLFARDPVALLAIIVPVIIGGLGLPVINDLRRGGRWSLHTRLTLVGTTTLTVLGVVATLAFEWGNPGTLGPLAPMDKGFNALFHSVIARSCGLNSVDLGNLTEETMMITYALMLIGAGSAGMGGGVKVTTVMILILAVWSEVRGDPDTTAFGRRISPDVQRAALTVVALAVAVLMLAVMVLRMLSDHPLERLIFEAISAFGNVGLSMGITGSLPPASQTVLILLMYLGRVGIVTVAAALALRPRKAAYRYPEERPIVG